jgi:hypothetical protein
MIVKIEVRETLQEFAFVDRKKVIPQLAQLAEEENWSSSRYASNEDFSLLFNYLDHTFAQLKAENKVLFDKDSKTAVFNTGLLSPTGEAIYGLCAPNLIRGFQPYYVTGFYRESARELSRFAKLPEVARYAEDPGQLVFDPRLDFRVDTHHLLEQTNLRLRELLLSITDIARALDGAISKAVKMAERNYRLAYAQCYQGSVQLLLPLYLTSSNKADLALVLDRLEHCYTARTCLTLEMARKNARLLGRVEASSWLGQK